MSARWCPVCGSSNARLRPSWLSEKKFRLILASERGCTQLGSGAGGQELRTGARTRRQRRVSADVRALGRFEGGCAQARLRTSARSCQKWVISFLWGSSRRDREGRVAGGRAGAGRAAGIGGRAMGGRAGEIGRGALGRVEPPGSGRTRCGQGISLCAAEFASTVGRHRVSIFPFVSDSLPTCLRSPGDNRGMGTFISHTSALHALRQGFGERASQSKAQPLPSVKPCLDGARAYVPEGVPVHVSVRDRASRGSHAFCYHLHRRSFPFGSFWALDEGVYVASPEDRKSVV